MKQLISENAGYKVFAELTEVVNPKGQFALRFLTEWDDATNPEPQQKFIMFVTKDELQKLKEMM